MLRTQAVFDWFCWMAYWHFQLTINIGINMIVRTVIPMFVADYKDLFILWKAGVKAKKIIEQTKMIKENFYFHFHFRSAWIDFNY